MHPLPTHPTPAQSSPAPPAWQRDWGESFRDARNLLAFLELDPLGAPESLDLNPAFPLRVPRAYAARMRKGDWNDPLLRQVLAFEAERTDVAGFTADAVGDHAAQDGPGVLRKYRGRALIVLTGECAVHCRYCFRREYPYAEQTQGAAAWDATYARLAVDPDVEELLFSGGDPLSLSDAKLRLHFARGLEMPRVKRLRVHTRVPVVLPSRVDAGFLSLIRETAAKKPLYIVLHVNHAREVGPELKAAAHALRAAGALLLNQSVLLRGVNDSVEALADLSGELLDAGIIPYYLHQLDRVRGAHGFEVAEADGLLLMEGLRAHLPGYGVPRYVREVAGEMSKQPVG